MPDVFTPAKRSAVMARIRSRGNRDTELALVRVFRAEGITGWRRQQVIRAARSRPPADGLRVRPDFVFPRLKLAVFVDGCFWHGCPVHATQPRNRAAFWRKKLAGNKARDRRVNRGLRRAGWRVLRIWEHDLARKQAARLGARLRRVLAALADRSEEGQWRRQSSPFAVIMPQDERRRILARHEARRPRTHPAGV